MRAMLISVLMLGSTFAFAVDSGKAFEDAELQARYDKIIEEVRCLKCQNQNIRDSAAFLAADLRREIRSLLAEGKTDVEIYDFLVSRYGDFALYRPRTSGKTLILWIAPFALLGVGALVLFNIFRHRLARPDDYDAGI